MGEEASSPPMGEAGVPYPPEPFQLSLPSYTSKVSIRYNLLVVAVLIIVLTAHLTPTIQEPLMSSPFFRTARAASHSCLKAILNQFAPSGPRSGSLVSPKAVKSLMAAANLSSGNPKIMISCHSLPVSLRWWRWLRTGVLNGCWKLNKKFYA